MGELFAQLKFDEIVSCQNGNFAEINTAFKKIVKVMKMADAAKDGSVKALVYVYYSGHGVMQNTSSIVLNEVGTKERFFQIENKLELLSKTWGNTYVCLVLDCCREYVKEE